MSADDAVWRQYEDTRYEVSNIGGVRRMAAGDQPANEKPSRWARGHRAVTLTIGGDGLPAASVTVSVAVMVCTAFHGPRRPGEFAQHRNGRKSDCTAQNVFWGERDPGRQRATVPKGEAHYCAKLTAAKVLEARQRHANGESAIDLAKEMGVGRDTMKCAIYGRTWKSVPMVAREAGA